MGFALIGGKAWRQAAAPAVALLFAPVALVATSPAGAGAVIAAMADPLGLLTRRSPGARPAGALSQSKQRRHAAGRPRRERAQPLTRQHPGGIGGIVSTDYVPAMSSHSAR